MHVPALNCKESVRSMQLWFFSSLDILLVRYAIYERRLHSAVRELLMFSRFCMTFCLCILYGKCVHCRRLVRRRRFLMKTQSHNV